MPSFADTPEGRARRRKFNARRAEFYHRARGYGLKSRAAGHATSEATFARLLQQSFKPRSRVIASGTRGNWSPHAHSLRVRVVYKSADGEIRTFFLTVSSDVPGFYEGKTVAEILDPIRARILRDYRIDDVVSIDVVRQSDVEPLAA